MKAILPVALIFISVTTFGQTLSTSIVDSLTNSIEQDSSFKAKTIVLDTLWSADDGTLVKTEVTFIAYVHPKTNHVHKIVCNNEGDYYNYVTIYYNKGGAIKGIVKAKYRRTDTNPEFETISVFYIQNDKVVKEIELHGNEYRANGFWYLTTINDFITLAGLKLK